MSRDRFLAAFDFCRRRRFWVALCLVALLGIAVWTLSLLPFDNSLEPMLPERSSVRAMIQYLREAGLAEKIAVSLECVDAPPGPLCESRLTEGVRYLAGAVQPPWVTGIVSPMESPELSTLSLLNLAPATFDQEREEAIRSQLEPANVRALLRRHFIQVMGPQGMFLASQIRRDPFGIESDLAQRAFRAVSALGFDVRFEKGLLLSADGRRSLVVLETAVPITDSVGAKGLTVYLNRVRQHLPAGVRADYLCGHQHTVSNEELLKRDIALTGVVETFVFFALLMICFRDIRGAVLIFLVPPAASLLALPLTALLTGKLSYLVVGLGTVIAGISVDYGVHSFVAVQRGKDAARCVRSIAGPVTSGMLTTGGLFVAFGLSRIPGYRQLGAFAVLSLCGALGIALFVLPQFVRRLPGADSPPVRRPYRERSRWSAWIVAAWVLAVAVSALLSRNVRFDGEIQRLDGVRPEIRDAERRFDEAWRSGAQQQAILAVTESSLEKALVANQSVYARARAAGASEWLVSLSSLWPSSETRLANQARWRRFWNSGAGDTARERLVSGGAALGFARDAFAPFFAWAESPPEPPPPAEHPALRPLWSRLVQQRNDQFHILSYFPDQPDHLATIETAAAGLNDAHIVSARAMAKGLSDTFSTEIRRITLIALACILLVIALLVRNPPLFLIVLIPPVSAVAGLFLVMTTLGLPINVANLMAGIVVFGLSVDYSYTMMHGIQHEEADTSLLVVHISALTTIVGTAVLLLARHPALFSIGLTLTIGVLCGYAGAVAVVPAALRLWLSRQRVGG